MYNIGHRKEIRISEVKRYLWSLKKGGFYGNRKKAKRLRGMMENHSDYYLNMGRKKKRVMQRYQYFSLREWKNDRIPHKKTKFSYRVIHEGTGRALKAIYKLI